MIMIVMVRRKQPASRKPRFLFCLLPRRDSFILSCLLTTRSGQREPLFLKNNEEFFSSFVFLQHFSFIILVNRLCRCEIAVLSKWLSGKVEEKQSDKTHSVSQLMYRLLYTIFVFLYPLII